MGFHALCPSTGLENVTQGELGTEDVGETVLDWKPVYKWGMKYVWVQESCPVLGQHSPCALCTPDQLGCNQRKDFFCAWTLYKIALGVAGVLASGDYG